MTTLLVEVRRSEKAARRFGPLVLAALLLGTAAACGAARAEVSALDVENYALRSAFVLPTLAPALPYTVRLTAEYSLEGIGFPQPLTEVPWQVALVRSNGYMAVSADRRKLALVCGGSWLGGQWIVTAAHCLDAVDSNIDYADRARMLKAVKSIGVVAGTRLLSEGPAQPLALCDYQTPESIGRPYRPRGGLLANDVLLLKLCAVLKNPRAEPAPLWTSMPDAAAFPPETRMDLSGWGMNRDVGAQDDLQRYTLRTLGRTECTFAPLLADALDDYFCMADKGLDDPPVAGFRMTACTLDSGGPVTATLNGVTRLVGVIAASTQACGEPMQAGNAIGPSNLATRLYLFAGMLPKPAPVACVAPTC